MHDDAALARFSEESQHLLAGAIVVEDIGLEEDLALCRSNFPADRFERLLTAQIDVDASGRLKRPRLDAAEQLLERGILDAAGHRGRSSADAIHGQVARQPPPGKRPQKSEG